MGRTPLVDPVEQAIEILGPVLQVRLKHDPQIGPVRELGIGHDPPENLQRQIAELVLLQIDIDDRPVFAGGTQDGPQPIENRIHAPIRIDRIEAGIQAGQLQRQVHFRHQAGLASVNLLNHVPSASRRPQRIKQPQILLRIPVRMAMAGCRLAERVDGEGHPTAAEGEYRLNRFLRRVARDERASHGGRPPLGHGRQQPATPAHADGRLENRATRPGQRHLGIKQILAHLPSDGLIVGQTGQHIGESEQLQLANRIGRRPVEHPIHPPLQPEGGGLGTASAVQDLSPDLAGPLFQGWPTRHQVTPQRQYAASILGARPTKSKHFSGMLDQISFILNPGFRNVIPQPLPHLALPHESQIIPCMSTVSILSCDSYEASAIDAAVRQSLEHLGGMSRFVQPGMRVLLKPNLLAPRAPTEATTTHPAIVAAVTRLVQEAGGTVTVADSPGGPFVAALLKTIYSATGMEQVARDTGLTLNHDFTDTEVSNPSGKLLKRLRLITAVAQADVVINLPKLKTHGQMVYTGAVKNLFGAIPGTEKIEYHMRMADYATFADTLIDIYLAAKPKLTVMDAVVGMEGAGPSAGDARQVGLILASEDAFALDYVALSVVGANPLQVPVMKAAAERGLCPTDLSGITVLGNTVDEVRVQRFNMPAMNEMLTVSWSQSRLLGRLAQRIKARPLFHHKACTGCSMCAKHCPAKVIAMDTGKPCVDLDGCIRCFCCQELCPAKAITIKRLSPPIAAVLRLVYFALSMISSRLRGRRSQP